MTPKNIDSYLWSVDSRRFEGQAGREIQAEVVIESYPEGEDAGIRSDLEVPEDLAPGKYNLMFLGAYEYENFLRKAVPYRFLATNYQTLVDALNAALNVNRTKLYCLLVLPPDGITLEQGRAAQVCPRTKALILQSEKRAVAAMPYPRWIEKTVETGTVIADKEMVAITVEK